MINTNNFLFVIVFLPYTDPNSRFAPKDPPTHQGGSNAYTISPARLAELRKNFLYWYFDKGDSEDIGDLQRSIHASNPQLHKNFNFQLPFYGFRFNYTRVWHATFAFYLFSFVRQFILNGVTFNSIRFKWNNPNYENGSRK